MKSYVAFVFAFGQLIVGTVGKSEQFFEIYQEKLPAESSDELNPIPFQSISNRDGVSYGCSGFLRKQGQRNITEFFKDDGTRRISLNNETISSLKFRLGLVSKKEVKQSSDLPLELIYPFSLWPSRCLEEFQFDLSANKASSSSVHKVARWEILSDAIYSNFITLVDYLRKFFGIGQTPTVPAAQGHVDVNTGCQYYGVESMDDGDGCLEFGVDECDKKSTRDEDTAQVEEIENKGPVTLEDSPGANQAVTIGGGGGGGGGGAFGGFGGSAQGAGVALDGSSAVGVYICNSEHITIIFGTPSPGAIGPSTPKYIGMDEFMIEESYSGNKRIVSITGGEDNRSKIVISTDGEVSKDSLTVDGTRDRLKDDNNKIIRRVSKVRVGWGQHGEAILYDTKGKVSREWRLKKIAA